MYKRVKKDTKWTIKHIGTFKTEYLEKTILNFDKEWDLDISRQNIGMTHKHTKMFRLLETDYLWMPGTPINTIKVNEFDNIDANKEIQYIYDLLENMYSGKILRCEVIKLNANSEVYKHTDGGALLHYSRRIHIPIITSEKITFTVYNNTIHMKKSNAYEINNQLPHSVNNPTDIDRVHIIIDVLPDDMKNYLKINDKEI